jgi:hypothetical protein
MPLGKFSSGYCDGPGASGTIKNWCVKEKRIMIREYELMLIHDSKSVLKSIVELVFIWVWMANVRKS